ncbi:hypothetical protein P7K49_014680, partial [Saguinus oedipus]
RYREATGAGLEANGAHLGVHVAQIRASTLRGFAALSKWEALKPGDSIKELLLME